MSVFHREGFWDNLYSIEILHQSAGKLRHLQAHGAGRALVALPVLQRLLYKDLWERCEGLHPPRRWWEECSLHRRVQRHLPAHRRKCGFLNPGGTTQCLQLWPKPGAAGEATSSTLIWYHAKRFYINHNWLQSCHITVDKWYLQIENNKKTRVFWFFEIFHKCFLQRHSLCLGGWDNTKKALRLIPTVVSLWTDVQLRAANVNITGTWIKKRKILQYKYTQ